MSLCSLFQFLSMALEFISGMRCPQEAIGLRKLPLWLLALFQDWKNPLSPVSMSQHPPPSILYTPTGGNQGPFTAVPRAYSWWGRASESDLRSATNSQVIMSSGQLELLSPTDTDSRTKGKDARHLSFNNTHTQVRKQPAQASLSLFHSQSFNTLSRNPSLSNDARSWSMKWCYAFVLSNKLFTKYIKKRIFICSVAIVTQKITPFKSNIISYYFLTTIITLLVTLLFLCTSFP